MLFLIKCFALPILPLHDVIMWYMGLILFLCPFSNSEDLFLPS